MNQNMRRLLDDDWDEFDPIEAHQREHDRERAGSNRKPAKPGAQQRRQQEREWGRSMAKFQRDRRKSGMIGKP